jgi:hypothetical protein
MIALPKSGLFTLFTHTTGLFSKTHFILHSVWSFQLPSTALSGEAKLPAVIKHLEGFLSLPLSGKVLVFCHHRAVMDGLSKYLTRRYG